MTKLIELEQVTYRYPEQEQPALRRCLSFDSFAGMGRNRWTQRLWKINADEVV